MNRKICAVVMCAVIAAGTVCTPIGAGAYNNGENISPASFGEQYYSYVNALEGIEFESFGKFAELAEEINGGGYPSDIHKNIYGYISGARGVYFPEKLSADGIDSVLVTPTYCSVRFMYKGVSSELRHYYTEEGADNALSIARSGGEKRKINGRTVFSYELSVSGRETHYLWEQDGECFEIIARCRADKELEKLCGAELVTFSPEGQGNITRKGKGIYLEMPDGSLARGWQRVGGYNYYFKKDGAAAVKNTRIGGVMYAFSPDGKCGGRLTGFSGTGSKRVFYLDGKKAEGWQNIGGEWFFLNKNGVPLTGNKEIDGHLLEFSQKGIWDGRVTEGSMAGAINLAAKDLTSKNYGYYSMDNNMLIIYTKDTAKAEKCISSWREKYPAVIFRQVKFSKSELKAVKDNIDRNMKKYGILGVGTSYSENAVEITVGFVNDELRDYLDSLPDNSIVKIEFGRVTVVDEEIDE